MVTRSVSEGKRGIARLRFLKLRMFFNREAVSPQSPESAAVTPCHPG